MAFDRLNVFRAPLAEVTAHAGLGKIGFLRVTSADAVAGACNFIDYAVLPPGASVGRHLHSSVEEEYYFVLEGSGTMWRNGAEFRIEAGDVVRNPPGGEHGLRNDGNGSMRILVFEVAVRA